MKPTKVHDHQYRLGFISNIIYYTAGICLTLTSMIIIFVGVFTTVSCLLGGCDKLVALLDFSSHIIISIAIFDVGRYLLEEEVFRDRELRSPVEARKSITKFMVIIVIAVTLEALLQVIKADKSASHSNFYPSSLLVAATLLLVGLGIYLRLSVLAEESTTQVHTLEDDEIV